MTFQAKLQAAIERTGATLCIGLDPHPELLPAAFPATAAGIVQFNRALIEATQDVACAYKPNSAFYEAFGAAGWDALAQTIAAIPNDIPVILDAKRGDIGSTASAYAKAAFDDLGADAVTSSPYLGGDALAPFLERQDKGVFVLCRTSNPGGADLQEARLASGQTIYEHVAQLAATRWNIHGNCGLVIGATYPAELGAICAAHPELAILIPGVGAQGGDLAATVRAAGKQGIIAVSRAISYADTTTDRWLEAASAAATAIHAQIKTHLRETLVQNVV